MSHRAYDLVVNYFVTIRPERLEETSYFRGFGPGILRAAPTIIRALSFPAHPGEIFSERDKVIGQRIAGFGKRILPLEITALPFLDSREIPLLCIISSDKIQKDVSEWIEEQDTPILHLSENSADGVIRIADAGLDVFCSFFEKALILLCY